MRTISLMVAAVLWAQTLAKDFKYTPRDYINNDNLGESYDYIIVGGGAAGLPLAARLSDNSSVSVLVLEAGDDGSAVKDSLMRPGNAFYDSLWKTARDWSYLSVPQVNLKNRVIDVPRGFILGGSTAMYAMYCVHPPASEIDAWATLSSPDLDPKVALQSTWGSESMFGAMKKSQKFNPPTPDIQKRNHVQFKAESHSDTGHVDVTYQPTTYPPLENWVPALESVGIPPSTDPYAGDNTGGYVAASFMNPTNWTRVYSKSAYIDPLPPRGNLAIATDATVTRILWSDTLKDGKLVATGVEFARNKDSPRKTVKANKEVILSAGVIGSPQILMLSGIGSRKDLEEVKVPVKYALDGVGQHLQDHVTANIRLKKSAGAGDLPPDIFASGSAYSKTPEFLSFISSGVAYVNLTGLLGASEAASYAASTKKDFDNPDTLNRLLSSQSTAVAAGHKAILKIASEKLLSGDTSGVLEILIGLNQPGIINLQVALQRTFSQGRVWLKSNNPFDHPNIDPQFASYRGDVYLVREGLKLARKIGQSAALAPLIDGEVTPGSEVDTDIEWDKYVEDTLESQFHLTSTCAMLPEKQGGVVDPELRVYGTANVRVADSSVLPIIPSSHLSSVVYALGEQAADVIKGVAPTIGQDKSNNIGNGKGTPPQSGKTGGSVRSMTFPTALASIALVGLAFVSL